MTRPSGLRVSTLLVVAAFGLAACGAGGNDGSAPATDPPATDPSTTESTANDPTDGPRCGVVVDGADDIDEYDPISCGEPHDAEFAGFETSSADPVASDDPASLAARIELMRLCAPAVEALAGRTVTEFGVDVGAVRDADNIGGDNVECWAEVATPELLVGTLTEVDLTAAIGDAIFLQSDLAAGECFLSFEVGYDLVTRAGCDAPGAEQFVAVVTLPGDEYPGEEQLLDASFELCDVEIAAADFDLISDQYGLVYPGEDGWAALGHRSVICAMLPADPDAEPDNDQASAAAPCAGSSDDLYPAVPCDEPHQAEFAGAVPPPVDVLPDNEEETSAIGIAACRDTVADFIGIGRLPLGITVGFVADSGLGEPLVGDVSCFITTDLDDGLLGSITDIGFEAAFQKVVVPELDTGSCFTLGESNFFLADLSDCGDTAALMFLGSFDLEDGPYPGADAIREIRAVECSRLLDESGLAADPTSVSGTFPGERDWLLLDQRTVACDATPV